MGLGPLKQTLARWLGLPLVTESALHPDPRNDEDDRYLGALATGPTGFDRRRAGELSRAMYERNPMARTIARIITAYVVGASVRVKVDLEPSDDDNAEQVAARQDELQAELDQWARTCRVSARWWRGLLLRYLADGEIAVKFVDGPNGMPRPVVMSTVDCSHYGDEETRDVVALVRGVPGGRDQVYRVLNTLSELAGDDAPTEFEAEVLWWARDAWTNVEWTASTKWIGGRGVPELLPLLSRLRWEDETQRLGVQRVKSLLRWFWNAKVKGATEDQLKEYNERYSSAPGTGTVRWTNDLVEWQAVSPDLGAYETGNFLRTLRGGIAGGAGQPAHWHGDGGDANLATATAMGDPSFRQLEQVQGDFLEVVVDIMTEVVRRLQARRRIAAEVKPEEVRWDVTLPRIDSRDYERGTRALLQAQTAVKNLVGDGVLTFPAGQRVMRDVTQRVLGVEITEKDLGEEPESMPDEWRNPVPPPPGGAGEPAEDDLDAADREPKGVR